MLNWIQASWSSLYLPICLFEAVLVNVYHLLQDLMLIIFGWRVRIAKSSPATGPHSVEPHALVPIWNVLHSTYPLSTIKASSASASLSFTIIITNGDSPSSSIITNEWPNDQLPKLLLKHAYASETITGFISPTSISCKTTKKTTIAIIRTSQESKIALTSQN